MDPQHNIEDLLHNLFEDRFANVDDFQDQLDSIAVVDSPNMSFVMLLNYKTFEAEKSLCSYLESKTARKDSLITNLKKAILKFFIRLVKSKSMVLNKNIPTLFVSLSGSQFQAF